MTGTDLELSPAGERAVIFWRHNPMLPASYVKNGHVDLAGMRRAVFTLDRLGLDPLDTLADTYVIHDQVGFKADLQRILLARQPGYDFEILEVDDHHVTARIKTPTGWKPPITKNIDDTDLVAYARRNTDNYRDKPRRMLEARVTTELVDLYAKGVLRGIVETQVPETAGWFTDQTEPAAGETGPVGEAARPPRSIAPDGATIPEHLREPEVDQAVRDELIARIEALDLETREDLSLVARSLRLPNIKTPRFTRAHGALLDRLITEAADRAQTVPAHVYDDAPEASSGEPGSERYDPDDPGRPF